MYGRVTKYFQDRGYGFIRGKDNNSYFIHHSNLNGEYIANGYYVYFTGERFIYQNTSNIVEPNELMIAIKGK